jgi:hypothetical protein
VIAQAKDRPTGKAGAQYDENGNLLTGFLGFELVITNEMRKECIQH